MFKHTHTWSLLAALAVVLGVGGWAPASMAQAAGGDSLLLQRVELERSMNLPSRGLTMAQVERRYGAPERKLAARGGGSKAQPLINRWEYSNYIVYFEHDHVIHSVLNTPAGNNLNPAKAG